MALRVLVFAALRVIAVYFAVQALTNLGPFLFSMIGSWQYDHSIGLLSLGYFAMLWIVAIFLWVIAGRLAVGITKGCDPTVQFQLTLEDAYALAFVFVGLHMFLSSIGSFVIDLVRVVSAVSQYSIGDAMRNKAVSDLYLYAITLAAGLAALIGHRKWARKLSKFDGKKGE